MNSKNQLKLLLAEGEGLKTEFKESASHLDREMVALANAAGGSIYIGIDDSNNVVGTNINNKVKSQIQDIARNCDPALKVTISTPFKDEKILQVHVEEGTDKPYRCRDGFYLRVGPSSQKLRRNEIVDLINQSGKIRFDEAINEKFDFKKDFSIERFDNYLKLCGINVKAAPEDILLSLGVAFEKNKQLMFTNAGVLFFAKDPQQYFPEGFITCVKYATNDRFSILDNKDYKGSLIEQIENALAFTSRHISVEQRIGGSQSSRLGQHTEIADYPLAARREAIINAVTHRDYMYDSSHIYINLFQNHVDIENPGGLTTGITVEMLGKRSARRNRLIADLLHRAGYINRVGSGFDRMERSLKENSNPPMDISATNFFNIRFHKRIDPAAEANLTKRQWQLYQLILSESEITKSAAAILLRVSEDTALRELNVLLEKALIQRTGTGRATKYTGK